MNHEFNNEKNLEKLLKNIQNTPKKKANEDIFKDPNQYYYKFLK